MQATTSPRCGAKGPLTGYHLVSNAAVFTASKKFDVYIYTLYRRDSYANPQLYIIAPNTQYGLYWSPE